MSPEYTYIVKIDLLNIAEAEKTKEKLASLSGVGSVDLLKPGLRLDISKSPENISPANLESFDQLNFGQTVKQLRLSLGFTQRDLSERSVMEHSVVGRIERGSIDGRRGINRTIQRIIQAFPWPIEDSRSQLLIKKAQEEGYQIATERKGGIPKRRKAGVSEELLKQVASLYHSGVTYPKMSSTLNVSELDILLAIRKLDKRGLIEHRAHYAPRRVREEISSFDSQVKTFYDEGLKYSEIATALGNYPWAIRKALERLARQGLIKRRS